MDWLKSYGIGSISEPTKPTKPRKVTKPTKRKLSGTKRKLSGKKTQTKRKLSGTKPKTRFAVSGNRVLQAHKKDSGSGYYVRRRDSNGNTSKRTVKNTFASQDAANRSKGTPTTTKRRTSGSRKSRRKKFLEFE